MEKEKDWDGNKEQLKRIKSTRREKEIDGVLVDVQFFVVVARKLGDTFLICGFIQIDFNHYCRARPRFVKYRTRSTV